MNTNSWIVSAVEHMHIYNNKKWERSGEEKSFNYFWIVVRGYKKLNIGKERYEMERMISPFLLSFGFWFLFQVYRVRS